MNRSQAISRIRNLRGLPDYANKHRPEVTRLKDEFKIMEIEILPKIVNMNLI